MSLEFCIRTFTGVPHLYLSPISVSDLSECLAKYETIVVLDVEVAYAWDDPEAGMSLGELARARGITCRPIDRRAILMAGKDVGVFASRICHYDFRVFDVPSHATEAMIQENASKLRTQHESVDRSPVLPQLQDSTFFLGSHDDCDLTVESHDQGLFTAIVGRTLQDYVGDLFYPEGLGFGGT